MSILSRFFTGKRYEAETQPVVEVVEQQVPAPDDPAEQLIGEVVYRFRRDGVVGVQIKWVPTIDDSKALGEFLYCLHTGKLKHSAINTLSGYVEKDISVSPYVKEIFEKWQELVVLEDETPLILPSEALHLGKDVDDD